MRKKREKEKKKGIKGNRKGELKRGREIGKGDRTRGGWGWEIGKRTAEGDGEEEEK